MIKESISPGDCTERAVEASFAHRAPELLQRLAANLQDRDKWRQRRGDFFGGTVAALIAVPYGMALSLAIGLRPEAGLYTSIVGGAISGMISDAPVVVSGLSATVVPVLAMLVKTHGVGAALAAGALSGVIMLLIGALRLGRFFNYLPQSVIAAFTSGLGVIIAASQFKATLGVKPASVGFDLGVVDDIWAVLLVAAHSDPHTIALSAFVIAVMFLLPLWKKAIPASLVAVIAASALPTWFGWQVARVGTLPDSFPHPSLAAMNFSAFSALIYPAFTLAGLTTINQLLTVVVSDRLTPTRVEVKFNRELVAQGVANMACPFFGAPPGVAMLARTVASAKAGAVSRWSVLAHSAVLLVFLLPMRNIISHIPLAVLAAVTVACGLQLISIERFRALRKMNRADAILFLLTFGLVIFSDLIVGVGIGALVAMVMFIERAAQQTDLQLITPSVENTEAAALGDLTLQSEMQIYRLTGPLFFASSGKVLTRLTREVTAKTLVLDLTEAGPIDSAATDCLRELSAQQRGRGGELHLIGLDARLFDSLAKDGLMNEVGTVIRRDTAPMAFPGGRLTAPLQNFPMQSTTHSPGALRASTAGAPLSLNHNHRS